MGTVVLVVLVVASEVEVRDVVVRRRVGGVDGLGEVEVVWGAVTGIVLVGTVVGVVGVVVGTVWWRVVVVVGIVVVTGIVVVAGRVVVVVLVCRPSTRVETSSANTIWSDVNSAA
jgi:hypothetical protein